MQTSNKPLNFVIPFASAAGVGYITSPIPQASQIGITDGAASLTDGFPPDCFKSVATGGVPPFGQDFNGILRWTSDAVRWQQAGYWPKYDGAQATAIGGYPLNALLLRSDGTGFWRSTVENNTANPDTGGANWASVGTSQTALNNTANSWPTQGVTGAYGLRFQNGTILQEGTGFCDSGGRFITFPHAFPTACQRVVGVGENGYVAVPSSGYSPSGFMAYHDSGGSGNFNYIAWGY